MFGHFDDVFGVEMSIIKQRGLNYWLTEGVYGKRNKNVKWEDLQPYSIRKYQDMINKYTTDQLKMIDYVWWLTDGEYINDTLPEWEY